MSPKVEIRPEVARFIQSIRRKPGSPPPVIEETPFLKGERIVADGLAEAVEKFQHRQAAKAGKLSGVPPQDVVEIRK